MPEPRVILKRGRDRSVRLRHPWVFSGAVHRIDGEPADGEPVTVVTHEGAALARGILNRRSQIVVRLLTWDPDEAVDDALVRRLIERAVARRAALMDAAHTDAWRLIHAEADGLPGLVVDRYGDWLVVQALALAAERVRPMVVEHLGSLLAPRGVVDRSDDPVRDKEGLPPCTGLLSGLEPPGELSIREHGVAFAVDLRSGHKTGHYLDQRDSHRLVAHRCRDADVLDVFAYTGGFSVHAAAGGAASLTLVEASAEALQQARDNLARNGLDQVPCEGLQGDAFGILRRLRDQARSFDVVVVDPPKFAPSRATLSRALRGYKDVNLQALKLLRPGGWLATFSCSGAVDRATFQTTVFQAAVDAGRQVRVVADLGQPPDHPVLLSFPESRYLKGLLCRVE